MLIIFSTILLLMKFNVIECEFKIIRNDMPLDMETQAIGLVIDELKHNRSLDSIALKLTQDYNQLYGTEWNCFMGITAVGSHFDTQPKTLLWFNYNGTNVILFKNKNSNNMIKEVEAVKSARNGKIIELFINATNEIKTGVFNLTKEAIMKEDDFGEIQSYLKQHLGSELGGAWLTTISTKSDFSTNWDINFKIDSALEFELGQVRFQFFHQKNK